MPPYIKKSCLDLNHISAFIIWWDIFVLIFYQTLKDKLFKTVLKGYSILIETHTNWVTRKNTPLLWSQNLVFKINNIVISAHIWLCVSSVKTFVDKRKGKMMKTVRWRTVFFYCPILYSIIWTGATETFARSQYL